MSQFEFSAAFAARSSTRFTMPLHCGWCCECESHGQIAFAAIDFQGFTELQGFTVKNTLRLYDTRFRMHPHGRTVRKGLRTSG